MLVQNVTHKLIGGGARNLNLVIFGILVPIKIVVRRNRLVFQVVEEQWEELFFSRREKNDFKFSDYYNFFRALKEGYYEV